MGRNYAKFALYYGRVSGFALGCASGEVGVVDHELRGIARYRLGGRGHHQAAKKRVKRLFLHELVETIGSPLDSIAMQFGEGFVCFKGFQFGTSQEGARLWILRSLSVLKFRSTQ